MSKEFDSLEYTREALAEELALVERHSSDGSAVEAGCSCIEEKHLLMISGLAREGILMAKSEEEKAFYADLAETARALRKKIVDGDFKSAGNPFPRRYLPHGLTECEKAHPEHLHKLQRCIRKVEKREGCVPPYIDCPVNPVAVCRAAIPCP